MPQTARTLSILIVQFPVLLQAQNLVPNPSFEDLHQCPTDISIVQGMFLGTIKDWQPVNGTPDIFNVCNTKPRYQFNTGAQVPLHWVIGWSYQYPHSGLGYAGIGLSDYPGDGEFLQARLKQQLIKDRLYKVEFYASMADASGATTKHLGIYLSTLQAEPVWPIRFADSGSPQITAGRYIEDTSNWEKISGIFRAKGGEEWITIGNFDTMVSPEVKSTGYNQAYPKICYFYIDDVSVIEYKGIIHADRDTMICLGDTLSLTALAYEGFYWSSNSQGSDTISRDSVYLSVPPKDTWYYLIMPPGVDSFLAKVVRKPDFYLASDTSKCFNESLTIAPVSTADYDWTWNTQPPDKV